jgi:hypothetical protein
MSATDITGTEEVVMMETVEKPGKRCCRSFQAHKAGIFSEKHPLGRRFLWARNTSGLIEIRKVAPPAAQNLFYS